MQKRKHQQLAISIALLGGAMLILAGCSWESAPVAKDPKPAELPLDKLKRAETDKTLAEEAKKKEQEKEVAKPVTTAPAMTSKQYPSAPVMSIDPAKKYTAVLHTEKGDIEIELAAAATPITVNNFVFLAREKFYDGVVFHRTTKDSMIQGGDPTGTGMGDPGYRFNDEPFTGEYIRGTVAMANAGPNTNGSQFFIMHKAMAYPKSYTIFGVVTKGIEVVDAIAAEPAIDNGRGEISKPVSPVKITSVDIIEK
ncbi:MAG: peptidylprolyl isomerase [Candidatus Moraniibacteriota bacterium]